MIDWTMIIVALISALSCGGLTALFTLRDRRKGHKLDNKQKESDIKEKEKDDIIEDWKSLAAQRKEDLVEARTHMAELRTKVDERDIIISDLRHQLDDAHSEIVALTMLRCKKTLCLDREPPYGYKEISIKNGRLEEYKD